MGKGASIGSLYASIKGDLSPLSESLNQAKKQAAAAGAKMDKQFAKMRKGVNDLDDSVKLTIPSFTQMGAYTFAATIGGIVAMGAAGAALITSAAAQAKEISNLSRLANMGAVDFQNYSFATDAVGVSSEKLADISKDVQDKLGDFIATGGGEFKDFFEEIAPKVGLTAEALQGLSGPDVLIAVKKAMDDTNVSAAEQIFYMESIANDATLLLPLLKDNGAALKEQAKQAGALGIALSEIDMENLLAAERSAAQLTGTFGALKNKVAAELSPAFVDITEKIINGMVASSGGVDTLAASLATGLLQGLGMVIETMRFFHNGWLGIKLVGTAAINAIAQSIEVLFGGLRTLMAPLDMLYEGAKKLGAIDVNPFDGVEEALGTFSASSRDVTKQVLSEIDSVNASYNEAKAIVDGYAQGIEAVSAVKETELDAHEEVTTALDTETESLEEVTEATKTQAKAAEKAAEEQAAAYKKMYSETDSLAREHFASQVILLDQEKANYKALGIEKNTIDKWYKGQYDELADKRADKEENTSKAQVRSVTGFKDSAVTDFGIIESVFGTTWDDNKTRLDTFNTKAKKAFTDDFKTPLAGESGEFEAIRSTFDNKWNNDENSAATRFGAFTTNVYDAFGDNFKTPLLAEGNDFDQILSGWDDLWNKEGTGATSLLSDFTGTAAGLVGNGAADSLTQIMKGDFKDIGSTWDGIWNAMLGTLSSTLVSMGTKWAGSAIEGLFEGWDVFHSGIWNIEEDEVPAILQKGEMVIPKRNAEQIRNNFGDASFDDLTGGMGSPTSVNNNLGTSFGHELSNQYTADFKAGLMSLATGAKDPGQVLSHLTSPVTAIGNVAPALSHAGLDAMNVAGSWSGWGSRLASLAMGVGFGLTGPVGALAGATAGFTGGILGDLIGDGLDAREFEDLRDMMEDGTPEQRKDLKSFIDMMAEVPGQSLPSAFFDMLSINTDSFHEDLESIGMDVAGSGGAGESFGSGHGSSGGTGSDMDNDGGMGGDPGGSQEAYARDGGVFHGDITGYPATLHGIEAVVPLPDGRSIPVQMQGADREGDAAILQEVRNLREDLQRGQYQIAKNTGAILSLHKRWDAIGQPEERDILQ